MILEKIGAGRGTGKTTYLVERVQEAQDEGADLVVVVVLDIREGERWAKWVLDWEIDPSRFMVVSIHNAYERLAGQTVNAMFLDNADLMPYHLVNELSLHYLIDVATYSTG